MSIGRKLLGKFGFAGAMNPEIVSLESVLRLVRPSIPKLRLTGPRAWLSQSSGNEFQSREVSRRVFNESLARIPVAR